MNKTESTAIYGLNEARRVEEMIRRLGIQDIKLMYDAPLGMWAVCQVKKQAESIVLFEKSRELKPYLLWWCKDVHSKPRLPNEKDVNDVIAVVHRAQHWFDKGGEALADALDDQDKQKTVEKEAKLRDRLQPHAKTLKKALKEL